MQTWSILSNVGWPEKRYEVTVSSPNCFCNTINKYILLDVLVCSIARCLYFDSPYGLVKILHNS